MVAIMNRRIDRERQLPLLHSSHPGLDPGGHQGSVFYQLFGHHFDELNGGCGSRQANQIVDLDGRKPSPVREGCCEMNARLG
jgi:hypothetical protein